MANKSIILLSLSAIVSSMDHKEQFSGQHSAVAEDASLHLGCVWDGESGCHDGCDPASMEARCQRFSHDQDACEGKEGQDDWCVWSHGDNRHRSDVLQPNANEASNKMGKISGKHADALSKDDASHLGCVWDGESGCHDGCDPVSMESRCQRFSHDQEACEGKEGQDDWCVWSHGDNVHRANVLKANINGASELTAYSQFKSADGLRSEGTGYGPSGGSSGGKGRGDGNTRESGSRGGSSSRRYSKGSGSGSDSESAEEPSKLGCVWDGTGCHTGECDTKIMEDRCSKFNHDLETCESDVGQYNRCVWSHGDKIAVQADEAEMEAMYSSSRKPKSGSSSRDRSSKSVNKEGCCYGTKPSSDTFCAVNDGEWACNKAGCEWMDDPSDCDGSYIIGCVWDGTGCHGDCDTKTMYDRCSKFNHDKDVCEGDVGQYNRCVWSHGGNTVVQADEVEMEAMMSHDSREVKQEEIPQRLGCIWDRTGCSNGCDMEAMDARCDRMSHDQEMCEGELGAFNRCTWSHGASGAQMNVDIRFGDIGEDSIVDILLIVAGVVTSLFIIHQLYRWYTKNSEYHKLQDTQHHDEIQITSHAV